MDFEDFLSEIYYPLKSIELLNSEIYLKYNEAWDFSAPKTFRQSSDELLAINFAIKRCIKYLLHLRKQCVDNL